MQRRFQNNLVNFRYGAGVALRKFMARMSRPIDEIDREKLEVFSSDAGGHPLDTLRARQRARIVGEIRTVRIVPRAGAPALEVVISDGRGSLTAIFLGRRKIGGIIAGRKLVVTGTVVADHRRMAVFNPLYELL